MTNINYLFLLYIDGQEPILYRSFIQMSNEPVLQTLKKTVAHFLDTVLLWASVLAASQLYLLRLIQMNYKIVTDEDQSISITSTHTLRRVDLGRFGLLDQ